MIELAVCPLDRIVALLAGGGEASMRYRTFCILVVGLVARNARRIRDVVIIVDVAVRASSWWNRMGAGQWESGLGVIELAIRPLDRVMTLLARGRKSRVRHRTLRVLVVGLVTRNARRIRDVVIVVDVAVRASSWWNRMGAGQRKSGLGVIQFSVRPLDRVMTLLARGRESRVRHRTLRILIVGLVARDAGGVGDVVVIVDVAIDALSRRHRV